MNCKVNKRKYYEKSLGKFAVYFSNYGGIYIHQLLGQVKSLTVIQYSYLCMLSDGEVCDNYSWCYI